MTAGFPALRMRRLRSHPALRDMLVETVLEPRHLVLPLFVVPGEGVEEPIPSMENVNHWSVDRLSRIVQPALDAGVKAFILFGLPTYKDALGTSAADADQPTQRACSFLRERFPQAYCITDVCLCQYTDHGHCGHLTPEGEVDNDSSLEQLARASVSHARAGAHMVAPSDMMDGRVGRIRAALDEAGFSGTAIMSYAAKMSSAFYGPFRDAAESAPKSGDRKSYQMPPGNAREALREALLDEDEGADLLMVKPALTCLDILARLREKTLLPLACYLVSGEYMMLRSAIAGGLLDEGAALLEAHRACRRAGADLIITYEALNLARRL
ncbi:porphobilinogen synthase [Aminiphilus sp.]|uniref:porphobilinogen synthase n=1 Tax=Aminiphilus sp. TaxID=1872488 RepID=UPI00261AB9D9|nr:porphobilinogen synthase [Aminiphilus sp.]